MSQQPKPIYQAVTDTAIANTVPPIIKMTPARLFPPATKQNDDRTQAPNPEPRTRRATDPTRPNLQRGSRATKSNTMPPTRRHQLEYTPAAKQLDDRERAQSYSPNPAITTATANTMPPTRRHQFDAPRPPSSLTTELSPKPEPNPSKHKSASAA